MKFDWKKASRITFVVITLIFLIIFYFYPIWEIASVTVRRL